jgi:aldose 1-epimerase
MDFRATTDKPTVINLINHSYFNMAGAGSGTLDDQVMTLFASHYLPVGGSGGAVPTGEIRSVAGSAFDFTRPSPIGPHLAAAEMGKGLDHTYVIDGPPGSLRIAARLEDPKSGRVLEVWTTQPGMQVYSANSVRPKIALAKGYRPHSAISFQTQHYPDSPNHPDFPSTELRPGQAFHEVTELRFSVAP